MESKNQTIKSGRGGARPNAGRKKGALTQKTREVAARVMQDAEAGTTPLEIMLKVMNWFVGEAAAAMASEDPKEREGARKLMVLAKDAAQSAAPFVHPRLAAVEHTGKDGKDLVPTSGVLLVPGVMSVGQWEAEAAAVKA